MNRLTIFTVLALIPIYLLAQKPWAVVEKMDPNALSGAGGLKFVPTGLTDGSRTNLPVAFIAADHQHVNRLGASLAGRFGRS